MHKSDLVDSVVAAQKFGAVMAMAMAGIAVLSHLRGHGPARNAELVLMGLIGGLALIRPSVLVPLERLWMKLGEALGRVMQPLVLGLIYFVLITPVALGGRLLGRDALRMRAKRRGASSTYWVQRDAPAIEPESFKHPY